MKTKQTSLDKRNKAVLHKEYKLLIKKKENIPNNEEQKLPVRKDGVGTQTTKSINSLNCLKSNLAIPSKAERV